MSIKKSNGTRVKIDDVARVAGVSTATVSRVLNGTGNVSPSTAQRVNQAIGDLKYVAHGSARRLASSVTNTIGLILPGISTSFLTELVKGVQMCMYDQNYALLMYSVIHPATMASGNPLPLGEHNTDGLIVFTDFLDDYSIQFYVEQDLPIVMLHRSPPVGLQIPKVSFENEQGAYNITKYLVSSGRQKIAYLRGPDGNEDSIEREVGYLQALTDAGIPFDSRLVRSGDFAVQPAKEAILSILNDNIPFDAVFCGDDNAAIGAIEALQGRGLCVPEDIAVAGFNDDVMSQFVTPPLTTVRAPVYQSGYIAAQKLLQLINGETELEDTRLDTEVIIRQSA